MSLPLFFRKMHKIRNQNVILDSDLAELYKTETKRLRESVRRNTERFPPDFMFELTRAEYNKVRSRIESSEHGPGQHSKILPFAFTMNGVAMLSSVLTNRQAIGVNIYIVRALVMLRQHSPADKDLEKKTQDLDLKFYLKFEELHSALYYLGLIEILEWRIRERKRIGIQKKEGGKNA